MPIELANTRFFREGELQEGLSTVADGRTFVRIHSAAFGVPASSVDTAARLALVEMRELVRKVLTALAEDRAPRPDVVRALNAAAGRRPSRLELRCPADAPPRARRVAARRLGPADELRADIAEATMLFAASDEAVQLRACPAPGCIGFFLPRHGRQEWCSVACGNRARNARFHERHRR